MLYAEAILQWNAEIQRIKQWCIQQSTSPDITDYLMSQLHRWRFPNEHTAPILSPPSISQAANVQNSLGWHNFLFGFFSVHWRTAQQAYYTSTGSRRTGRRWAAGLFKEVVSIPWQMWNHRCRVAHLPTSYSTQEEHRHLNSLIQAEYDTGTLGWRDRDRRWFSRPKESLYSESVTAKKDWLQAVQVVRDRHRRRQLTPHQQSQQIMHNFLHPS